MKIDRGVTFKATGDGVLLIIDGSLPFPEIKRQLQEHIASADSFFRGAGLVLEIREGTLTAREISDLEKTVGDCCNASLVGVTVSQGGNVTSLDLPGIAPVEDSPPSRRRGLATRKVSALIVTGIVRSGQRVRHSGHVVLMGDVNPGGEVVASGDIIVLGRLRGVAHAGATGDEGAVIAASSLEPSQLRIAGHIRRAPDGGSPPASLPEVARIRSRQIVVETYTDYLEKVRSSNGVIQMLDTAREGRY